MPGSSGRRARRRTVCVSVDLRTRTDADVPAVEAARFFGVDLPGWSSGGRTWSSWPRSCLRPLGVEVDGRSWGLEPDGTGSGPPPAPLTLTLDGHRPATGGPRQRPGHAGRADDRRETLDEPMRIGHGLVAGAAQPARRTPGAHPGRRRPARRPRAAASPSTTTRPCCGPTSRRPATSTSGACSPGRDAAHQRRHGRGRARVHRRRRPQLVGHPGGRHRRVVRMQQFEDRSPTAAALLDDDRFAALGALPGLRPRPSTGAGATGSKPCSSRSGVRPGDLRRAVAQGLQPRPPQLRVLQPDHRHLGHRGGPGSGQLRVIPGSHRALVWPSLFDAGRLDLPDVALATETGDVTLHLSCTLHMAQPPTERERKVLYTGFRLPPPDPAGRRGEPPPPAGRPEPPPSPPARPPPADPSRDQVTVRVPRMPFS